MAYQPPNTEPHPPPYLLSPPKLWLFDNKYTNYVVWRSLIHDQFKRERLLGFIDGSPQPPTEDEDVESPDYHVWRKSDERAKEMLLSFVDKDVVPSDPKLKTCRDIWLYLKHKFLPLVIRDKFNGYGWLSNRKSPQENYELVSSGTMMSEYMKLHRAALLGDVWAALHLYQNDVGALINHDMRAASLQEEEEDDHLQSGSSNLCGLDMFPPYTSPIYSQPRMIYHIKNYLFRDSIERSLFVDTARFGILFSAIHAHDFGSAGEMVNEQRYLAGLEVTNKSALICLVISLSKLQYDWNTSSLEYSALDKCKDALTFWRQREFCVDHLIPNSWFNNYANADDAPRWFTTLMFLMTLTSFLMTWIVCICCFPPIILYIPWKLLTTLGFIQKPKETRSVESYFYEKYGRDMMKSICKYMKGIPGAEKIYGDTILLATKLGVHEIVDEIISHSPGTAFSVDPVSSKNILHMAVESRNQYLFRVIHEQFFLENNLSPSLTDMHGNNMLHFGAKLSPPDVLDKIPGSVLQIQHELKWYKEIEKIMPKHSIEAFNHEGKTPKMIFTEEHNELKDKSEKWMKDTATSCTIIAALISTIMFATAITVPGGNNGDTGFPLFRGKSTLVLFAIFDAISFITSVISLLMFVVRGDNDGTI